MKRTVVYQKKNRILAIWLVIILVSNVCFYSLDTLVLYGGLVMISLIGVSIHYLKYRGGVIRLGKPILYFTGIYIIFFVYGIFFLRSGIFNWDMMALTYITNILLMYIFSEFTREINWVIAICKPMTIAAAISVIYLVIVEWDSILAGDTRVGEQLSGNVNSVAVYLGVISIFVLFMYCESKFQNKYALATYITLLVVILLTGSKKSLVYIFIGFCLYVVYAKKNALKVILIPLILFAGIMALFKIPALYEILGKRTIDFIKNFLGISGANVSNSTSARMAMIKEGMHIFTNHPLLGGGERYFGLLTITGYDYSHCNYIELLCNYGIVGTLIFYSPIILTLLLFIKEKFCFKAKRLCVALLMSFLITGWMMVSYTDGCIVYLPVSVSMVLFANKEFLGRYGNIRREYEQSTNIYQIVKK